ncbi:MAG: 2-amino-4-hydroxy-6-hydroxymethyldihydropteridine diphosphokinase [Nitrospirota bacterium]|nr:2-amino-4-hydroxy-6-hydroxymethyldihydropteridine diphosphokinase [Nitrospirota bacterium]
MATEVTAYVAFGANLGDRVGNCLTALRMLNQCDGVTVRRVSRMLETDPVGPVAQGAFVNGAAEVITTLGPEALLACCLRVEEEMGRVREERWGPRLIDLDLILYGDRVIEQPGLSVPHPEMHRRTFVLASLYSLAADLVHPVLGKTVAELLESLRQSEAEAGG